MIKILGRGLVFLIACLAASANAALLVLDPTESGEIHQSVSTGDTPSQPFTSRYSHRDGLDGLLFSSELGAPPPAHTTGDFGHRNLGYLIFDLSSLGSDATSAFIEFDLSALGADLGNMTVTAVNSLTASELSDLPTGALHGAAGESLMSDLSGPALGLLNLVQGSGSFNVALNAAGLAEINAAGNLLALGINYNWNSEYYNAQTLFHSAPRLHLEADIIGVAAPGSLWLILGVVLLLVSRKNCGVQAA